MINLSKRLQAVADLVSETTNNKIIDIGCDHGLLDVYLAQKMKNIEIIATDINSNALNNAKENIKKHRLSKKIETRLGNGLDVVMEHEINTVIISGMGSHTIVGVLYKNINKLKNVHTLIIQSNNNIDFLRKKISKIDYYIEEEKLVKENNIIYTIIKFKKGRKFYNYKQLYFGPILLKEKPALFYEKNKVDLKKLKLLYSKIPKKYLIYRFKTFCKIKLYQKI